MGADFSVSVRFYRLSEAIQPYFTALYATTVECEPGVVVTDCLHPEWAALRFTEGPEPLACIGPGELVRQWPFVANGPTSKAIHFGVTRSRIWGLGLQPAGWSKFVPQPADSLSDRTVEGSIHEAFALFAPISSIIENAGGDADRIATGINDFLMGHVGRPAPGLAGPCSPRGGRDPRPAAIDPDAGGGPRRRPVQALPAPHPQR